MTALTPDDNSIRVRLSYPRIEGNARRLVIELDDVRAADDLTIAFDYERNGWRIGMDLTRDGEIVAADQEVGFVPAWNDVEDQS